MEKRRYALRLAYVGEKYSGFQRQPGLPTVEKTLASALEALGIRARLEPAARTDAGVHALGQVVSFWARRDVDPAELRCGVNRFTPDDIVCLDAARVPSRFHARASAVMRRYVYLVGHPPPPSLARYTWTLPDPRAFPGHSAERLDAEAVRAALSTAVGTHDFAGYARPGEQTRRGSAATVRTLSRADLLEASSAPLYAMVFEGTGFIRAMLRNLAGTVITVGLGLAPVGLVAELLATRERYRGVRAPGRGLTLAQVIYPPEAWG